MNLFLKISGNKNKIKEAIPDRAKPIKNQTMGLLPILLAKRAVTKGMLKRKHKPIEKKILHPFSKNYSAKLVQNVRRF
ncbi:MAG: hypothetical protein ACHQII_05570 [Bacteroidia bacterium]